MVRYRYIEKLVYELYRDMPEIKFPLNLETVVDMIPNCRHTSYQRVSCVSRRSMLEVAIACESTSGCTYYDRTEDRYLIMTNEAVFENNTGRRRWTLAHEIGHIMCGHFLQYPQIEKFAENDDSVFPVCEKEADYFAATLLAPIPFFDLLNIRIAKDVQWKFMLSAEASRYRINEYARWKNDCRNIQWFNDMRQLYLDRGA